MRTGETSGDPNTLIDDGNRQQQGGSRHQISLLLSVHLSFLPWSGLWFVVGEGGNGRSLVDSGGRAGFQLPGSMGMDVGQAPTPWCGSRMWPGRLHSSAPYEHQECLRTTNSSSPSFTRSGNVKAWEGMIHPKPVGSGTHQLPEKPINSPSVSLLRGE